MHGSGVERKILIREFQNGLGRDFDIFQISLNFSKREKIVKGFPQNFAKLLLCSAYNQT